MRAYTALCSNLLFPLHERMKGHHTVATLRRLERSQWLDARTIQEGQLERLKTFLASVNQHVPFYRELFRASGFEPRSLTSAAHLQALPLLDKATIRKNFRELISDEAGPLSRSNTGGSSGEPLIFLLGKQRKAHDVAAKWRATRWWGVDIGDREMVIWGSPVELNAQDRLRKWRDLLFRSELLPAFDMSESNLDNFVDRIRRQRPKMLFGYPSALALIAGRAEERGVNLRSAGIKVAFVTSERLYEHQRSAIERVFGCDVANGYGGRDAGFIAHQCPSGGMHVCAEDIVVEIVDANGGALPPGEPGEIVVTHMATGEFPFVRYRTGDIGTLSDGVCPCGRGLPLLKEIQGRTTDFVVASDGTMMHALALIYPVRETPGVKHFKIVQHDIHSTEVRLVVSPEFTPEHAAQLQKSFRTRLGSDVDVVIQLVDRIDAERSGKYRYVVSNVAQSRSAAVAP